MERGRHGGIRRAARRGRRPASARELARAGPVHGREAVVREFERIREALDVDVAKPISAFIDAGHRVVVRCTWGGRGPAAHMEMSCVYAVMNGRMTSMDFYFDHAEALEAAGLPK